MSILDRLRSRLALRIYAIGLLQVAIVAVGFYVYLRLTRPDRQARTLRESAFTTEIIPHLDQPEQLQKKLEGALDSLEATITVIDPEGRVLATTTADDAPPCVRPRPLPPTDGLPPPPGPGVFGPPPGPPPPPWPPTPGPDDRADRRARFGAAFCHVGLVPFEDGRFGRIEFRPTKPPPRPSPFRTPVLIMALVVVGISSLALSRSIAKPLRRLSAAARALGEGDLDARTGVSRSDELGDVAKSFDVMAGRIGDLLRAERELVANVSHELRTPLARIRVALDIAAEGDVDLARESLADIAEDIVDLERLVSDLLAAARLDIAATAASPGGIPPLKHERLSFDELVATVVQRFEATHPERTVELEMASALPALDADPVLLRRVVDNLLENARKYSAEQDGPIEVAVTVEDDALVLTVTDHGIGIAAEDLPRVFEPFFRADKSRTRATGGHGLGLALAHRIVEAHGGRIRIDSTLSESTRVEVRLPG